MPTEQGRLSKKTEYVPITSFILPGKTIGEMIYNTDKNQTSFATFRNGNLDKTSKFKTDTITYQPYSAQNPLIVNKVVRFPSSFTQYESSEQLLEEIRQFIHNYLELPKTAETITLYYVFLTWAYDTFNELPYLRVRGDYGSGKTRFLNVVSALCYKPIMASGASTVAPLFHILNKIGGTLVLDEADFQFSSETADITKILNNGNARGFPVLRCQIKENKEFRPKAYTVFGPKLIASRNNYQDEALESRCITFDLDFTRHRSDIPLSLPADFENKAQALRNKLLVWRFRHLFLSRNLENLRTPKLSSRLNQIYTPLLSIIDKQKERNAIIRFAQASADQARIDQGLKTEADLLKVIKERSDSRQPLTIGGIADDFRRDYGTLYERKITPNWIGCLIRLKLRLRTCKSRGGLYAIAERQQDALKRLYEKYDLTD